MALTVIPFDPARHLETGDDIRHYLDAAMAGNDARHIARALGDVARSRGMSEITLPGSDTVTLESLTALLRALGLELAVRKPAA
jgi:DNA-binding phage protein